jgi:CRP-like cAMP-binding protein
MDSGVQRVIGYLLRCLVPDDCASPGAATVSLPVSESVIDSRLSLTPEYFSHVLHELETAKLIEINRREIRIPDPLRLSRYRAG